MDNEKKKKNRHPSDCARLAAALLSVALAACEPAGFTPPTDTSAVPFASDASTESKSALLTPPPQRVVPGEFLVRFKAGVSKQAADGAVRKASMRSLRTFATVPGLQLLGGGPAQDSAQLKQALARNVDIEYVEPNFIYHSLAVPNDPDYATRLWALNNTGQTGGGLSPYFPDIHAEDAWDITTGSASIVVGVIDSGVDYNHEDLAANVFRNEPECDSDGVDDDANGYVDDCHGIDAVEHDSDPMDGEEHGTHVSGTIGAVGNNGIGIAGVAWRVKILPCRFLDDEGNGTTAAAIECLDYMAAMRGRGINLIASNNSWGNREDSHALADAIRAQRQRGILFVAAAGNNSEDVDIAPEYPCAHEISNIICVGATYESIELFSNFGDGAVHLGAPGVSIYSTVPGNRYDWKDGTSMAAPHVTGALVLLAAQDPSRDWRGIRNLVIAGAVKPREWSMRSVTDGRLDLMGSMHCVDSEVLGTLRPTNFEELHRATGSRLLIRALHVRCASPGGDVSVTVAPGGEIVTLRDDGAGVDEVAGDGEYTGEWTAQIAGLFSFSLPAPETETFSVLVDADLKSGFPLSSYLLAADGWPAEAQIAIGNIDANPDLEILSLTLAQGPANAWRPDGSTMPGWPLYEFGVTRGLSLGEFDGDATRLEVAANYTFSGMHLYGGDGRRLPNWPQTADGFSLPAADLDRDGTDELIGNPAMRSDGTRFRTDIQVPARPEPEDGFLNRPAVADLDADDRFEIISTSEKNSIHRLWISDHDGVRPGFPVVLPGGAQVVSANLPLIGDVDGDGKPNIVLRSYDYNGGSLRAQVQIFDARGALLRTLRTEEFGADEASLADLDGDGFPEIVMTTRERLFAWKGDGVAVPGWPVSISPAAFRGGQVVVGDIDGNGLPDVIATGVVQNAFLQGDVGVYAFRHDGTAVSGFPKFTPASDGSALTPAIADIDLDGRNELVVNIIAGPGKRQNLFVYDLHGAGTYGGVEWGQFMGDARRRGYYESGKNLRHHAFLATQVYGSGSIGSADGGIACGSDCIQKYAKGTNATLTATANAGATFARWRGACAGQGNPCTLPVTRFTETSADFTSPLVVALAGSGGGTVTSDLAGISCPADCTENYAARSSVLLTATPPAGTGFERWEGACTGTQPTCAVFIDNAKAVTARFTNRHTVTVNKVGMGALTVTSNPTGIVCGATSCAGDFSPGSTVALTFTPAANAYLYSVIYPSCNVFVMPCQVTMNGPQTVEVNTELKPVINLTILGNGQVSSQPAGLNCTVSCAKPLDVGGVQLTAIPPTGGKFVRWEGACTGETTFCSLYLDRNREITAIFDLDALLTIDFSGDGAGTVATGGSVTCTADCSSRLGIPLLITFTATPSAGSTFGGWSGACSGATTTCQVNFNSASTVGVTFTRIAPPNGAGSSSGGGSKSGGGGSQGWLDLAALAAALCLAISQKACRAMPGASRTRWVSRAPCGSNLPA